MTTSNQGREIDQLIIDINRSDLAQAAVALWEEIARHPSDASCECPVIEAIAVLYEKGYRLIKS